MERANIVHFHFHESWFAHTHTHMSCQGKRFLIYHRSDDIDRSKESNCEKTDGVELRRTSERRKELFLITKELFSSHNWWLCCRLFFSFSTFNGIAKNEEEIHANNEALIENYTQKRSLNHKTNLDIKEVVAAAVSR